MTPTPPHEPRVRYQVAASLDGFIATADGGYDWIPMDPDIDFGALFAQFDTLLMGHTTFEGLVAQGNVGQGGAFGLTTCVVSRTLPPSAHPGIRIDDGSDLAATVADLKRWSQQDIWLFGGGALFASLAALGLVDRVEIAVVPVVLRAGVPLMPPGAPLTLALAGQRTYETSGIVLLEYDVLR